MRVVIRGSVHWLWRAVDQHGTVLEEIVQRRRAAKAARRLLRTLLKKQDWRPRRIVTDKLDSYAAARRKVAPSLEHRAHKGLNNRAENSHVPLRKRERQMQRFRSPGGLRRFTATFFCGCRSVCKEFLIFWTCDRVRSFVRPVRAADWRRWPGW